MKGFKEFRYPASTNDGGIWIADLWIAAYLVSRGHEVEGLEFVAPPRRYAFCFRHDETLEADVKRFSSDEPIKKFISAISSLKILLSEEQQKNRPRGVNRCKEA